MKKLLYGIAAVAISVGLGFSSSAPAKAASNTDMSSVVKEQYKVELVGMTDEEVAKNFDRIDKEYAMGEAFSLEDQAFVEMYAKAADSYQIFASKSISGSKTKDGITVKVSGTIKDDIQNIINQSFSASNVKTSTTAGASKVTSIKTTVHHNAYGLVGSGGVGKVYSGTLSATGKNSTLNGTKKYTAVVAYASTWCTATVKYGDGSSFTVNPD